MLGSGLLLVRWRFVVPWKEHGATRRRLDVHHTRLASRAYRLSAPAPLPHVYACSCCISCPTPFVAFSRLIWRSPSRSRCSADACIVTRLRASGVRQEILGRGCFHLSGSELPQRWRAHVCVWKQFSSMLMLDVPPQFEHFGEGAKNILSWDIHMALLQSQSVPPTREPWKSCHTASSLSEGIDNTDPCRHDVWNSESRTLGHTIENVVDVTQNRTPCVPPSWEACTWCATPTLCVSTFLSTPRSFLRQTPASIQRDAFDHLDMCGLHSWPCLAEEFRDSSIVL